MGLSTNRGQPVSIRSGEWILFALRLVEEQGVSSLPRRRKDRPWCLDERIPLNLRHLHLLQLTDDVVSHLYSSASVHRRECRTSWPLYEVACWLTDSRPEGNALHSPYSLWARRIIDDDSNISNDRSTEHGPASVACCLFLLEQTIDYYYY